MSNIKQKIVDFLDEIKDLSNQNKNRRFKIDLKNDADLQYSEIKNLYHSGCLRGLERFYRIKSKNKHSEPLAPGSNLDMYDEIPTVVEILLDKDKFNLYYKEKKAELEDLARCYYEKDICILNVNEKEIPFKNRVGLVLYFLYQSRLSLEYQDYHNYNDFLSGQHYYKKYRQINSDQLRRDVDDINAKVKRDTGDYILNLISKKQVSKNSKNLYKWDVKIK